MSRTDRDDRRESKGERRKPVVELANPHGLSAGERILSRLLPAAAVSAGVHLVVALAVLGLSFMLRTAQAAPSAPPPLDMAVEERTDTPDPANLTEQNVTLDTETGELAVKDAKLADDTIQTTVPDPEPAGNPDGMLTVKADSLLDVGNPNPSATTSGDIATGPGAGTPGGGNNGLQVQNQSLAGRGESTTRNKLLETGGGNSESEAAVARGLAWLARAQKKDGTWVYDKGGDNAAATGMGLLPFLAAGQTHKPGKDNKYRDNAAAGISALLKMQKSNGSFSDGMYAHAIATVALCEAYGMTGDKTLLLKPCQSAIEYIQKAQGQNGSWGYKSGDQGDTSIVGWQVQALHSAKMCKDLKVDPKVMEKAMKFLDSVASKPPAVTDDKGKTIFAGASSLSAFGYSSPGPRPTLTAVGLLCRYYLNGWGPNSAGMRDGVQYLLAAQPPDPKSFDMYYYYYATQVAHFREGDEWHKEWNPKMRDLLIAKQVKNANKPNVDGSWDPDTDWIGPNCGRVGTTAMALLTLEVYYRHLPLYNRDTGGKNELDSK